MESAAAQTIRLTVNGTPREVDAGTTVDELLRALKIGAPRVATEVNCTVVPRETYGEWVLRDGDVVEIVHFVGGG